ncbi:MAG: cytochrome c3 family protein [Candidatus Promineifilaceae bacterium]|nr:cytochrome c3 family protein [Candidatus Promineifilaceae bacterium]
MSQIFHPATNAFAKATIFGAIFIIAGLALVWGVFIRSSYVRGMEAREQPVPFSHEHHVSGLGIDCRYCHSSVETSAFAGMPATHTCMTCHSQVWTEAPALSLVRQSWQEGTPIAWNRVYDLPDFVYFNHAVHVSSGFGCDQCHGRVDEMPLTAKAVSLTMEWCLECHRAPERSIRPRSEVFNLAYRPPADQEARGRQLLQEYDVPVEILTDCSLCHR